MIGPCSFCKREFVEIKSFGIACGPQGGFKGACAECTSRLFEDDEDDD